MEEKGKMEEIEEMEETEEMEEAKEAKETEERMKQTSGRSWADARWLSVKAMPTYGIWHPAESAISICIPTR